jgi:Holliday junction resolvase RusA-like endonuclease
MIIYCPIEGIEIKTATRIKANGRGSKPKFYNDPKYTAYKSAIEGLLSIYYPEEHKQRTEIQYLICVFFNARKNADADNLLKAVMDAAQDGQIINDDKNINHALPFKIKRKDVAQKIDIYWIFEELKPLNSMIEILRKYPELNQ